MKKFIFLCITCLCLPIMVQAYILPVNQVFDLIADHFGNEETLSVTHKFLLHDQTMTTSSLELMETIHYRFPNYLNSELNLGDKRKLHVISPKGTITILDDKILGSPQTLFDRYKELLVYRSKSLFKQRLVMANIRTDIVSLGKFQKKPVWVIGAQYLNENVPQLWVDNETFQPVRWIIKPYYREEESLEIQYLDWSPIGESSSYPKRILYYRNHELIVEITMFNYELEPDLSNDLFDISFFKRIYQTSPQSSYEDPDMNEVQKTIQNFRETFQ